LAKIVLESVLEDVVKHHKQKLLKENNGSKLCSVYLFDSNLRFYDRHALIKIITAY
jgi:hypothetical protein